jgi:hypothetical protein
MEEDIFELYPNPATDHIVIHARQSGDYSFRLLDLTGKEIFRASVNSAYHSVAIGDMSPGIYFYSILKNGQEFNGKIFKR